MSDDEAPTPAPAPKAQPANFTPFVGFETPDGQVHLRRHDLIRGFNTRSALGMNDGCVVEIAGEKPITSKTPPASIAAQIRSCIHWVETRQINEGFAIEQEMLKRRESGILTPR